MSTSNDSNSLEVSELEFKVNEDADFYLQLLVHMADVGIGLPVTLTVGGTVVSGILTNRNDYFNHMAESLKVSLSESGHEVNNILEQKYLPFFEPVKLDPQKLTPVDAFLYIHLRDAHIFIGGQIIPTSSEGIYWRGRISEVSGFNMGTLQPTETI